MMRRIVCTPAARILMRAATPIVLALSGVFFAPPLAPFDTPLHAASSAGCEGGGFSIILPGGATAGELDTTVPASSLGTSFLVKGKYVEFGVPFQVPDTSRLNPRFPAGFQP